MGTRAVVTFIGEDNNTFHVYKHWDGDPGSMLPYIEAAKPFAWELPRFEADEFAAAFVAANKQKGGGDIRLTNHYDNHGDLEFRYEVSCVNGELKIDVFVPTLDANYDIDGWSPYVPEPEEV